MFSSDKNIETIGQLIEAIRHYIGLQTKYAKLDVIEKIVRLLTAFVMMITLAVLLMLMLIYASFAAAFHRCGSRILCCCGNIFYRTDIMLRFQKAVD